MASSREPSHIAPFNTPNYFALYEKNKVMAAAEYGRLPVSLTLQFTGLPPSYERIDYQKLVCDGQLQADVQTNRRRLRQPAG